MISCILVAHGKMGRGLINAATVIVGEQDEVYILSNSDLSLESLKTKIAGIVSKVDECIVFVDCLGSAYTAARIVCRDRPVVSGVNLPMLLSFFTKRERLDLEDLLQAVINDGRKGILAKFRE